MQVTLTVGVLALQGGFAEHLTSLRKAGEQLSHNFRFIEVRTPAELATCDALVIPGGESTTLSLVAVQSGLLEPLREFVKVTRKPTWGTCAGLIFLSEEASATKRGGQELVGGLDVRVHRNHFGRQRESFITDLSLDFLQPQPPSGEKAAPFPAVFIRAPVVDKLLNQDVPAGSKETRTDEINGASPPGQISKQPVEVLAVLAGRHASNKAAELGKEQTGSAPGDGDIVALQQGNVLGMSFHPELTTDVRIHKWWLEQVVQTCVDRH